MIFADKIVTGENFFIKPTSLFDAMPACWKRLTVEERQNVMAIIDGLYRDAEVGKPIWTKLNILRLVKYVSLDEVLKLRGCYLAAKRDPSVIVFDDKQVTAGGGIEEPSGKELEHGQQKIDQFCTWQPKDLVDDYKRAPESKEIQKKFLDHITNHVADAHWEEESNLVPSSFLDVEVHPDQIKLLNPKTKNIIRGYTLHEAVGKGAKTRMSKRRIDYLDGNVGSYFRSLNDKSRIGHIKDVLLLTASLAGISKEKDDDKFKSKERADQKVRERKLKRNLADALRKDETLPTLKLVMAKYEAGESLAGLKDHTASMLKDIVKYYYGVKLKGLSTMKKPELMEEVRKRVVVAGVDAIGNNYAIGNN